MQSYELLREVFDQKTPKQVAADLGLSLSMVYKWAEPPTNAAGSGTGNPLDRIEALLNSTGDRRLVQWICQRAIARALIGVLQFLLQPRELFIR